jgi:hypothetical protein
MVQTNEANIRTVNSTKLKIPFFYKVALLFLIITFIFLPTKFFIFIPLFAIHIAISWFRNAASLNWIGFELILVITVLSGILLGPLWAIMFATLALIINYVLSGKYIRYIVVTLPLYLLIALFSPLIPLKDFVMWGIIITIIYNVFSFILSSLMGAKPHASIIFAITNILFNIFIFNTFGNAIIKAVGV